MVKDKQINIRINEKDKDLIKKSGRNPHYFLKKGLDLYQGKLSDDDLLFRKDYLNARINYLESELNEAKAELKDVTNTINHKNVTFNIDKYSDSDKNIAEKFIEDRKGLNSENIREILSKVNLPIECNDNEFEQLLVYLLEDKEQLIEEL
jgi:peptidoglycan hydrolase CwlO-like protein